MRILVKPSLGICIILRVAKSVSPLESEMIQAQESKSKCGGWTGTRKYIWLSRLVSWFTRHTHRFTLTPRDTSTENTFSIFYFIPAMCMHKYNFFPFLSILFYLSMLSIYAEHVLGADFLHSISLSFSSLLNVALSHDLHAYWHLLHFIKSS